MDYTLPFNQILILIAMLGFIICFNKIVVEFVIEETDKIKGLKLMILFTSVIVGLILLTAFAIKYVILKN